jgi:hypothetical protein
VAISNPHRKSTESSITFHTVADKIRAMFKARYTKIRGVGEVNRGIRGGGEEWVKCQS